MGAYLSSPVCDKDTTEGSNEYLAFAASSMQGWRMSQEDAHNAVLDFDDQTSFFAVYDGHGGAEIALYCARHLPDFLKQLDSYREGRLHDALSEGFVKFDSLLLESSVKEILQQLANSTEEDNNNDDLDEQTDDLSHKITLPINTDDENNCNEELNIEEAQLLKKEAELPIEELLKNYGDNGKHFHSPIISKRKNQHSFKTDNENIKNSNESQDSGVTNLSNESEQIKSDLPTHTDEQDTPINDISANKAAETTTNGEIAVAIEEVKPSSSESKTTSRCLDRPASVETIKPSSGTVKSNSLTHHLLSENIDQLEDEVEDEDDFEYVESDDESSSDEAEDNDEDEDEDEDEQLETTKEAEIKNFMKKSIMAILNRHSKKKNPNHDSEDDVKENQNDDEDKEENVEEEEEDEEDDEDIDDENDADLGKMLDMSNDPGSSSGCTAVITLLRDKQLYVANAGDSRCVVCRNGQALDMSIDHKPEDPQERSRIEKAGYKVTLDGRVSGGLNLSRAIGDHAYKKTLELPPEEQAITALPDVRTLTLEDQDEFMIIACDGIWNFMSSQDVIDFIRYRLETKSLSQICEELFMHCLAPNTSGDGTGCDNMTAIIVKFNFHQTSNIESNNELHSLNSVEHSPWPTMFTSVNKKRLLSPEHVSTAEAIDDNNSKKFKTTSEKDSNLPSSPSKMAGVFSFNAVTATTTTTHNNDLNDE